MSRFLILTLVAMVGVFSLFQLVQAAELGSSQTMEKQLISVLDEQRVRAEYYPLLLKHAGKSKTPQGIVDMFDQETEKFLSQFSERESKLVRVQIVPYVVPWIRALLSNSPDEAQEAVRIHLNTKRPPRLKP